MRGINQSTFELTRRLSCRLQLQSFTGPRRFEHSVGGFPSNCRCDSSRRLQALKSDRNVSASYMGCGKGMGSREHIFLYDAIYWNGVATDKLGANGHCIQSE
jgi:hypothetical protein